MKMLLIHSEHIKYKPTKKALKYVPEVDKKEKIVENALVVFMTAEAKDENNVSEIVRRTAAEIKDKFDEVKAKNILIYPYAHLSSDVAKPYTADRFLKETEKALRDMKLPVQTSPFGWYKEFQLKCLGHPLAESFKEISLEKKGEIVSKALKAEEKIKSNWFIMKPDGEMLPIKIEGKKLVINKFDEKKYPNLLKFAKYEIAKDRVVREAPPHIKMMRGLELADFESVSDPGNLRFYPKGRLIKSLLEQFVTQKTVEYGAMEVECPLMYDVNHPAAINYLNKFPARQYTLKPGEREFFLRFSACFGQFCMADDMVISHKNLPLRLYELTRYSFRREKKSELAGLRRLRAFTMPDVHAFCKDIPQAMKEFKVRFELCQDILGGIGFGKEDCELAVRFTQEFYDKNKDFIASIVKLHGRPALIETWDRRVFYFVLKMELNIVDALDKASTLATDQIDIENAERYNITYIDEKGQKQYPIILHCSPSGAIERDIYGLLEKAYLMEKAGKVPELPMWLSPTQVRVIPVSDKHNKFADEIAKKFDSKQIRADVDDRSMTIQKRVREAELEWVPYILVAGEKEKKSGKLNVRIRREKGREEKMSFDELIQMIKDEVKGKPFMQLSLPKHLSKRPVFVG